MAGEIQDTGAELKCVPAIGKDLNGFGGMRQTVGPFVQDNISANQSAAVLSLGATAAPQKSFCARRAGSITGLSAAYTVTTAGAAHTIAVYKNGQAISGCSMSVATDLTAKSATFAKDLYTFAADDLLTVTITTDGSWSATTSDVSAFIEIEE